jgi:hypothetical protein
MQPRWFLLVCLMGMLLLAASARAAALADITADPPAIHLEGPTASYTLLIQGKADSGQLIDLTADATYRSLDHHIASVAATGTIRAMADGHTTVLVEVAGRTIRVPVFVERTTQARQFNFENDLIPLFSRFGCNSAGCHGKAEGQNGFKLSVFGFDPAADYAALTKESRGRRVLPAAPKHSLLLQKVSGRLAHGGGVRIRSGSAEYETLRAWIGAGMPFGLPSDPKIGAVRIEPHERQLDPHARQQLRVIGRYFDGREVDVTALARFQSNNDGLASVTAGGLVTAGEAPGEVAIMASYLGSMDVFRAVIPRGEPLASAVAFPENNFIDRLVAGKFRKLCIVPSDLADDPEYLRRIYLDVIGTLPTPAESRRFLADHHPDRRSRLVEDLLQRPEFADYWALKWADLLRVDREVLGRKRAYAYYRWIRQSMAENKPLDQFARELITAEGPLGETGAANFYKVVSGPGEAASTLSQVFLGVRIACAQCHHHPFDRWSTADYYGMEAFFTPISLRPEPQGEMVMATGDARAQNPRTGEIALAHALGNQAPVPLLAGDPRPALAAWMTAPDNPWFARNLANRTWAHFLGRGLVEPVDDVRATNPPTNPELLDALAHYLVQHHFDFRTLVRVITASRIYQLSSHPNRTNERDELNYSRALLKRIDAEVLLDMVCQATGVAEKFPGVPAGYRAIQLWDSKVPHYFLRLFGRPVRTSACVCERNAEPGVAQVLHLLNSPALHDKLTDEGGSVARLIRQHGEDAPLIEELYLTFYSRYPSADERRVAREHMQHHHDQRRQAAEDLAWSMMNSLEFMFNH